MAPFWRQPPTNDLILAGRLERHAEERLSLIGPVNRNTEASANFPPSIVDTLRVREISWADIAEPLGASRQSAWERFS